MLQVTETKKYWFTLSGILVLISIILIGWLGLNLGIDFTGGALLEIEFLTGNLTIEELNNTLNELEVYNPTAQTTPNGAILRFQTINETMHQALVKNLEDTIVSKGGELREIRFESIGPSIGYELGVKSIKAIIIVLMAIVLYISWAFRKVSRPVSSWKYGVVALLTLFHDVIIVIGIFVLLGQLLSWQINAPFIAAILTVLGYSVNDTIVIFDRIRENIRLGGTSFDDTINNSVKQTINRSINTSITTLLVLGAVYIFGGDSIKEFVLALIMGIIIGTYSSIFLASPLLSFWHAKFSK